MPIPAPMTERKIPPGVDIVQFMVKDDKVVMHCLVCLEDIGSPYVLADAIRLWEKHQEHWNKEKDGG